jgi:gas vesicle protein
MSYLDQVKDKRGAGQASKQLQADIREANREVVDAFKQVVEVIKKPAVNQVKNLSEALTATLSRLDSENTKEVVALVKNYQNAVDDVKKSIKEQSKSFDAILKSFVKATQAIQVNVPQAEVTVNEREIDFTPLIEYISRDKLDLNDFKANDFDDKKEVQYIGFIHPSGVWYIVENDFKKLRYLFGKDKYASHWRTRGQYEYKRLDEAYNAITA